jgi:hypothetical protein
MVAPCTFYVHFSTTDPSDKMNIFLAKSSKFQVCMNWKKGILITTV